MLRVSIRAAYSALACRSHTCRSDLRRSTARAAILNKPAHLVASHCSLHCVIWHNVGSPESVAVGPTPRDGRSRVLHDRRLGATSRAQRGFSHPNGDHGRTAKGRRPYSVGARLPPSSDGAKIAESATFSCVLARQVHENVALSPIFDFTGQFWPNVPKISGET